MLGATDQLNDGYATDYPYQPRPAAVLEFSDATSVDTIFKTRVRQFPWLAAVLSGYFAVSDVAALPLTEVFHQSDWGAIWIYLSFGAIWAQAGLLSAGLVFGPGHYWKRLFCFWVGVTVLCILWSMGFELMAALRRLPSPNWSDIRFGVLALPLAAIAIQSPLWYFRLYRDWRLTFPDDSKREQSLSIRDYMFGTAIVALSITMARLAVKVQDLKVEYWGGWSFFFGIAASLSLVSVIPALPLMFRCDWRFGLIGLMLYAAIGSITFLGITEYVGLSPISPFDIWEATGFTLVFMSFAAFLGLGLKAARDIGLCLASRNATTRWKREFSAADERG